MHFVNNFLLNLLPTVEHLGIWGYWVVLFSAFLESLALIGSIVPGGTVVVLSGFLSSQGYLHLGDLIIFSTIGAILGDGLSYYLGTKGTHFFKNENKILKEAHLDRGKAFFKHHGNKSIFLGRFIPVLRPIVPFVAGLSKMDKKKFLFWNILSAILWATTHVVMGYFFGGALSTVEVWSTRVGVFVLIFIGVLSLLWFLVKHSGRFFSFLGSVLMSIGLAIWDNEQVVKIRRRYPRTFNFFANRLNRREFMGLPLTVLTLSFLYLLISLIGITEEVVMSETIKSIDIRLANLLFIFRHALLTKIFLWFTVFGTEPVVVVIAVLASMILWFWRRPILALALWISVTGSSLFVLLGKYVFHQSRPSGVLPVYIESSFSFPSGHASIAIALYGFLLYALWRMSRRWKYNLNFSFIGVVIILGIGFSRLYLGVHYLSDVVGGYLVGGLWLIVSITLAEWYAARHPVDQSPRSRWLPRVGTVALVTAAVGWYVLVGAFFHPKFNVAASEETPTIVTDTVATTLAASPLPKFTEGFSGAPQEPISFIITAENDNVLVQAMSRAGWHTADDITLHSLAQLVGAAVNNQQYVTAPMTPSFWDNEVNDFGFERPTNVANVSQRHHARFWRTTITTTRGELVYVGTASLDKGLKWVVTHKIQPDIDTERDLLLHDLTSAGVVATSTQIQFVAPTLGKNFSGDAFFTDGKAYVVTLTAAR